MDTKKRILVAEDDGFLARAYEGKLGRLGYEVKIVGDGEQAVAVMDEYKPDVVVLDVMMPKVNGFEVLAKLRSNPKYENLPVIMATNLSQPEDIQKAKELKANYYAVKSDISLSDLMDKIASLIQ